MHHLLPLTATPRHQQTGFYFSAWQQQLTRTKISPSLWPSTSPKWNLIHIKLQKSLDNVPLLSVARVGQEDKLESGGRGCQLDNSQLLRTTLLLLTFVFFKNLDFYLNTASAKDILSYSLYLYLLSVLYSLYFFSLSHT